MRHLLSEPNTTPPPAGSSIWFNVTGYILLLIQAVLIFRIMVRYYKVWRMVPGAVRLLPMHVIVISAGTLLLSSVAVARMIQFPRPIWGVATLIPVAIINYALYLVGAWQRKSSCS